jgi:integrase
MSSAFASVIPLGILPDMGRRRSQRTGTLREKSGSWLLTWREDVTGIDGVRRRAQMSTTLGYASGPEKMTRKEAQRAAWDRVLSKLDDAVLKPAAEITMRAFVKQRFIPDHVEMKLKPAGKAHYDFCLSHILPAFGDAKLRDLNRIRLQDFLNSKRGKLAPETIGHLRNALSAIFRHADRSDMWGGKLPTVGLIIPRIETPEKRALTTDQAARLVASLHGQYSVMAAFMLATGLRIGEAAGLTWKRVDFASGIIEVRESWCREFGYQSPKTARSVRRVPMPETLRAHLLQLRGRRGPDDSVFYTAAGTPVDKRASSRNLKRAGKTANVPWVSWHILRHTHATLTDGSGLTVAERQKVLGHSSPTITMDYTHPEMARVRGAVDAIAAAVISPLAEKETVM